MALVSMRCVVLKCAAHGHQSDVCSFKQYCARRMLWLLSPVLPGWWRHLQISYMTHVLYDVLNLGSDLQSACVFGVA